jgi:hypothetical protein
VYEVFERGSYYSVLKSSDLPLLLYTVFNINQALGIL